VSCRLFAHGISSHRPRSMEKERRERRRFNPVPADHSSATWRLSPSVRFLNSKMIQIFGGRFPYLRPAIADQSKGRLLPSVQKLRLVDERPHRLGLGRALTVLAPLPYLRARRPAGTGVSQTGGDPRQCLDACPLPFPTGGHGS
jgi:hypothetical protein